MRSFFFPPGNQTYFTPIVAELNPDKLSDPRTWQLAMSDKTARQFCHAPDHEKIDTHCVVFWYKVALTQKQQSELINSTASGKKTAFLSFNAEQIFSLVHVENGKQNEYLNPYCSLNTQQPDNPAP